MEHPEFKPQMASVKFSISGEDSVKSKIYTKPMKIIDCGININKLKSFECELPNNRYFCPLLEVSAWETSPENDEKKIIGFGCFELFTIVK